MGNFNNDGILDVITGNNGGNSGYGVSVNLGKGDGRFQSARNSAPGMGTFDMAIGDFNGDGKLDVALAGYVNSTQGILQIMLGNGGTFTKGQSFLLPNIPNSITTTDFNADGHLDLAVAMDKVSFYKGAGNGPFTSAGSITVGAQNFITSVRVGDFNADGKPDLSVGDGANLYALWGQGNFTFTAPKLLGSYPNGISATPVDVNQDHYTDLLVIYFTCPVGKDEGGNCTNWEVLLGTPQQSAGRALI